VCKTDINLEAEFLEIKDSAKGYENREAKQQHLRARKQ